MDLKEHGRRFWSLVDVRTEGECWNWKAGVTAQGYGRFIVDRRPIGAHRVAYTLTHGSIETARGSSTPCVCHTCDNRLCCNPAHLFIGSCSDNISDMWHKGRGKIVHHRGELHGRHKLTEEQVREIRAAVGTTGVELAHRYGVTSAAISLIRLRKKWKHVA